MIVIISKDKDFSHTLAEQVVRELGQPCECLDQLADMRQMNNADIRLVVTQENGLSLDKIQVLTVKPRARMREVLVDIHQLLKAPEAKDELTLSKALSYLPRQKELRHRSGKSVGLTDKEGQLIAAIAASGEMGLSKDELLKAVWNVEVDLNTHTLETHIYRLRAKCKDVSGDETIVVSEGKYRL
jgi:two-component SAPR family response regulator